MILLKYLRMIQTLHNTGSLSAAANKLYQTQSALSHQCSTLEKHLGFRLFIRKSQPLHFTPQGKIILNLANTILPQVKKALYKCYNIQKNTLRITIECHSCVQCLILALDSFYKKKPYAKIDFINSNNIFDPKSFLKKKELDIVLTSNLYKDSKIYCIPMFDVEMRLILSPNHPLSKMNVISPKDLSSEKIIIYPSSKLKKLDIWKNFFKSEGIKPNFTVVENTHLLIQMVAARMGISALPYWIVEDFEKKGLIITRSFDCRVWNRLYAAVRNGEHSYSLIKSFIYCICKQSCNSHFIRNLFFFSILSFL